MTLPRAVRAAPEPGPWPLELFTSQGCSSCPAADAVLAGLVGRADLLPLAFHVTYWDRLGWRDSLGDPRFTERQRWYARLLRGQGLYTPQLVVAGEIDLVGTDSRLERLLSALAARPHPALITIGTHGEVALPAIATTPDTVLWAVRYEDRRSIAIARGENAGATVEYRNSVRDLIELGAWDGAERRLDLRTFGGGGGSEGSGLAVVAQDERTGRILASGRLAPHALPSPGKGWDNSPA